MTVLINKCGVLFTACKIDHLTNSLCQCYLLRLVYLILSPNNAQLAVVVASEHVQLSVLVESHRKLSASLYLHNVLKTFNLRRQLSLFVIAMAQSPKLPLTPSKDLAILS